MRLAQNPILTSLSSHWLRVFARMTSYWILYGFLALVTFVSFCRWIKPSPHSFPHIPAVGYSAPILSSLSALRFLTHGGAMVQEGYDKYKGGVFKIPELSHWHIIVTGPKLVEELRSAGDELSLSDFMFEAMQVSYTIGRGSSPNPYHVPIIRTKLTRRLGAIFPDLLDEIRAAFTDFIPLSDGDIYHLSHPCNVLSIPLRART